MHTLFCLILLVSIRIAIWTKLVLIISQGTKARIRPFIYLFSSLHRQTWGENPIFTGATIGSKT